MHFFERNRFVILLKLVTVEMCPIRGWDASQWSHSPIEMSIFIVHQLNLDFADRVRLFLARFDEIEIMLHQVAIFLQREEQALQRDVDYFVAEEAVRLHPHGSLFDKVLHDEAAVIFCKALLMPVADRALVHVRRGEELLFVHHLDQLFLFLGLIYELRPTETNRDVEII